jgi:hypothetical protein
VHGLHVEHGHDAQPHRLHLDLYGVHGLHLLPDAVHRLHRLHPALHRVHRLHRVHHVHRLRRLHPLHDGARLIMARRARMLALALAVAATTCAAPAAAEESGAGLAALIGPAVYPSVGYGLDAAFEYYTGGWMFRTGASDIQVKKDAGMYDFFVGLRYRFTGGAVVPYLGVGLGFGYGQGPSSPNPDVIVSSEVGFVAFAKAGLEILLSGRGNDGLGLILGARATYFGPQSFVDFPISLLWRGPF